MATPNYVARKIFCDPEMIYVVGFTLYTNIFQIRFTSGLEKVDVCFLVGCFQFKTMEVFSVFGTCMQRLTHMDKSTSVLTSLDWLDGS